MTPKDRMLSNRFLLTMVIIGAALSFWSPIIGACVLYFSLGATVQAIFAEQEIIDLLDEHIGTLTRIRDRELTADSRPLHTEN